MCKYEQWVKIAVIFRVLFEDYESSTLQMQELVEKDILLLRSQVVICDLDLDIKRRKLKP